MTTRHEVMIRVQDLIGERATRSDEREIGIFGSVARGEDDNLSDIDLLVEFGSRADLIGFRWDKD
jgi:predicted nucleotidyltransferase